MMHSSAIEPPPRILFVAWQDPERSAWYTIGRLSVYAGRYIFRYTRGFAQARDEAGARPIYGFPDATAEYSSEALFPLFSNRLMRQSRPDYPDFVRQLGLSEDADPMDILARSEGFRATDSYRIYACPQPIDADGLRYRLTCFSTGLRYQSPEAQARSLSLRTGESLDVVPEPANPHDPDAHQFVTVDGYRVGYAPRYHAPDLSRLGAAGGAIRAIVELNNVGRVPWDRTLLIRLDAPWPEGFVALDTDAHRPLT